MRRSPERTASLAKLVYLLAIFGLIALAAWALLQGRFGEAAIAIVCAVVTLRRPFLGLFATLGAALLGAWLTAALTLVAAVAVSSRALAVRLPRRRPPAPAALSPGFSSLPEDLPYGLAIRAAGEPLSTWHVITVARLTDASTWSHLGRDPGAEAWDGPVIALEDSPWPLTLFFAEAAGLCGALSERLQRSADLNLLALAACAIPLSAASEWGNELEPIVEQVLGISLIDFLSHLSEFAGTPAGSDLMRRMQVASWAKPLAVDDRELIFEMGIGRLPALARSLRS